MAAMVGLGWDGGMDGMERIVTSNCFARWYGTSSNNTMLRVGLWVATAAVVVDMQFQGVWWSVGV